MGPDAGPLPWRPNHLIVVYVSSVVSAVLVLMAWWGTSGTTDLASQVRWVNAGVSGLILMGSGYTIWLLHGRRAVTERRRRVLAGLESAPTPATAAVTAEGSTKVVAGDRMTRYHRPECPLVIGKPVKATTRATQERARRRPCGVCSP